MISNQVTGIVKRIIMMLIGMVICHNAFAQPLSPAQQYKDLFLQVQMQGIFPDQKTFVDCIPKNDPEVILKEYNSAKNRKDFDLINFVSNHFELPADYSRGYTSSVENGILQHINELWKVLSRPADTLHVSKSSLIPLPNPYVVPGGRFREIYYWDSYFTMLGLEEYRDTAMIESMVKNFAYLIDQYGFVPNGNRTYYLSRSQPPFFSLMIDLLAELKGEKIYIEYLPQLIEECNFWMEGGKSLNPGESLGHIVNVDGKILNRYWDDADVPREESYLQDVQSSEVSKQESFQFYRNVRAAAESGWDFSSRWFADGKQLSTIRTTDIIPVDLNCLLYHLEKTIAKSYAITKEDSMFGFYERKATERKESILTYFWNDSTGWFHDYLYKEKRSSPTLTLAGLFPLFFEIADKEHGSKIRKNIQKKFLQKGGVITTLNNTGEQWDAPNGWAPLEYIAVQSLDEYEYHSLARKIAKRWIRLNVAVFNRTGKMMEKYNVEDIKLEGGGGEYPLQDGFGWTNGVFLKLTSKYGIPK